MRFVRLSTCATLLCGAFLFAQTKQDYLDLMHDAGKHAAAHGEKVKPTLSANWDKILDRTVPADALRAEGFGLLAGTTHNEDAVRRLLRMPSVQGLITDRPDIVQQLMQEAIAATKDAGEKARIRNFDIHAHRGGRGLRPESTLPSFENGMDLLVGTLEMDFGVTNDKVAMIWHDEYYLPKACRRADGTPYTKANRVWLHDISSAKAQLTFICDKMYFEDAQKNDPALSPVSVAFARQEKLPNIYTPISVDQIFRFVKFYGDYYQHGPGKASPHAAERVREAGRVRFDIETKLIPDEIPSKTTGKMERTENNTFGPQTFVTVLMATVNKNGMKKRIEVQSFDFRTLRLIEEQFPDVPTFYLPGNTKLYPSQWKTAK
ncbi:MAG: glycerophosphodiester phosphodiesterase [Acidobacteria bacterium]|nr:glycerophosphodiester phosphodiesterase [Acidobacteriota bacterium]